MARNLKHFRRGETTYTCHCCKKLTRNTGGDERAADLCLDCYELAGIENYLIDNCSLDDLESEARERITRRPELAAKFPEIVAALSNGGKRV